MTWMTREGAHAVASLAVATNATVDLNYTPWGEDDSPFPTNAPPTYCGKEETSELQLYMKRLDDAKQWIETEGGAKIGAVLLDQERWEARANASWASVRRIFTQCQIDSARFVSFFFRGFASAGW